VGPAPDWPAVWQELRDNLFRRPACPQHPEFCHVRTLSRGVINDILEVSSDGIRVRSHRTCRVDFIEACHFRAWWEHLVDHGSASLYPGSGNTPPSRRARTVSAIMVAGLPNRIRKIDGNVQRLK
jgi:hypothetical protein